MIKKSVYAKIERGYPFKFQKNDIFINDFNYKNFNQDGNDSAILETKYYNPPNLLFQHLLVKVEVIKT